MNGRVLAVLVVLLLGCTRDVGANPILEDAPTWELNGLVSDIVAGATPAQEARFVEIVGRHGLDFLRPRALDLVRTHFSTFSPLLVRAQSPGHAPNARLQHLFEELADPAGRAAMRGALRAWLREPVTESPWSDGIDVEGASSSVQMDVLRARAIAAEVLSDYGDAGSLPLIETLHESACVEGAGYWHDRCREMRWYLNQSARRLEQPDSAALLVPNGQGGVRLCRDLEDIVHAELNVRCPQGRSEAEINPGTAVNLLSLLRESRLVETRSYGGGIDVLEIRLRGGYRIWLSRANEGRVLYRDNTRLESLVYILENPGLFRAFQAMVDRQKTRACGS
jgi:hypothetical protein